MRLGDSSIYDGYSPAEAKALDALNIALGVLCLPLTLLIYCIGYWEHWTLQRQANNTSEHEKRLRFF